MVREAIANAYRHGIATRAGRPNAAQGDCAFEAVLNNLNIRQCFIKKIDKTTNEYRWEWVTKLQKEQGQISIMDPDKYTIDDWEKFKTPGTYNTDIADLAMLAIARGCNKDILIFNTEIGAHTPIYVLCAEDYEGGG